MGWKSVSAIPALAGRQNRKIFVSLIEKNFGGARIKKCKENFSVLSAVRRAETLGGIQSAKSSGFCSKWVRISSNKHHQDLSFPPTRESISFPLSLRAPRLDSLGEAGDPQSIFLLKILGVWYKGYYARFGCV